MVNSTTHNRSQCKFANRIEYIYFSVLIVNRKSGEKKKFAPNKSTHNKNSKFS